MTCFQSEEGVLVEEEGARWSGIQLKVTQNGSGNSKRKGSPESPQHRLTKLRLKLCLILGKYHASHFVSTAHNVKVIKLLQLFSFFFSFKKKKNYKGASEM